MTDTANQQVALPVGASGKRSVGWWGVGLLIVTEASLFGYLLLSYYYLWTQNTQNWPPEILPKLMMPSINTVLLLTSSLFAWLAERSIAKGRKAACALWLCVAIGEGIGFMAIQFNEWSNKNYGLSTHLYGSLYFTITGFHMFHVAIGLVVLSFLLLWTCLGYFDARRYEAISIGSVYWHFVDVVWLFIFSTFFLVPYLQ